MYDRFLTLLNNLSLVGKEYVAEDSNTKFLRALPEEWDTQTSIIRHQYDLSTVSLDEAKSKGKAVEVSRRKSRVMESDPDDSSSDTDGNPDANTDDDSTDSDMEEMVAMIVRGFKKMKFRKARKQGNFQKKTFNAYKDKYIKKDNKNGKFDKSKIRCYKCNGMGHFATECKKAKALITSSKDLIDSFSESDTEVVNYALMANTDETVVPVEKVPNTVFDFYTDNASELRQLEFANEKIRAWTDSGRKFHEINTSKNWKECLGYKSDEDKKLKEKVVINETVSSMTYRHVIDKTKTKIKPVKFVFGKDPNSTFEKGSTSAQQVSNAMSKPVKKNIGLLSQKQLKEKVCEVTGKQKSPTVKRNRNGKVGINKENYYKFIPNAPRKCCYICGNSNHLAIDCRKSKKKVTEIPSANSGKSKNVNVKHAYVNTDTDKANPDGFYPVRTTKGKKKNVLVMDSGCSVHMTENKALLSEYEEKAGPTVSYGDGNIGQTLGYDNIIIGNVIIEKVALVKGLKHNLLSISQITDKGYHVNFYSTHCEVVSKASGKVALTGYRHGNIYEANIHTNTDGSPTCLISKASVDESCNWHKKLSHLNFSNINELIKKDLVRGLPKALYTPDGLCDACQKAKQRRTSFNSKSESSIGEPYHMLHLDLFGPCENE
ncbi:hypothetical protein POM88_035848 [Heracleum sosnowskyi]|uniref:CCHC-type domain-containing protein n=1 Tax=Heracleum sosnowskyi TaxID=360622 RepID=A0AAD8HMA8_9APIA|nr:hypothetical protein POM88_035848 [Heracleum sosnowskyi]